MAKLFWVAALMAMLALLVPVAIASTTTASSPSPSSECFKVIYDMMDCFDYVIEGSNTTSPGILCCMGIKKVVEKSSDCICAVLAEAKSLNISLNTSRTLGLPNACSVKTPPLNNCSGAISPVHVPSPTPAPSNPSPVSSPAPAVSPAQSPATTEAPAPAPSGAIKLMADLAFLISMAFAVVF